MSSDETNVRVKPVFFKSSDVPQENNNWLNTWEICIAASEVVKEINAEKSLNVLMLLRELEDYGAFIFLMKLPGPNC